MDTATTAPSLSQRIAALLVSAQGPGGDWMRRLLGSPDVLKAYGALSGELFLQGERDVASIAIASATRGEGRTTLALVTALLTAATDPGRKVLLVDADIERPSLGPTLGLDPAAPGLAELFAAEVADHQCIHSTVLPNLHVTPAGRGKRGTDLLAPSSLEEFLLLARQRFDLVILDSPAAGANRAILPIARIAQHAVVVVRYGGPTREQVASLVGDLERAGVKVLGCVMNRREYVVPAFLYG